MDLTPPEQHTPYKAPRAKWKWATRNHLTKIFTEGFLEEAKLFSELEEMALVVSIPKRERTIHIC